MNFLRQPPFPLTLEYLDLESNTEYFLEISNTKSSVIFSTNVTTDSLGKLSFDLPQYFERFDATYSVYVYSLNDDEIDETKVIDTLTINRAYINPFDLTEEDPEEYVYFERMARSIIDFVTGGFYYKDDTVELVGLGGDYLAMPNRINKINFVYKNNIKVYDRFADQDVRQDIYVISPNHSAITIKKDGVYNRLQSKPLTLPLGASDSFNLYSDSDDPIAALTKIREFDLFPLDADYVIVGEFGWPVVPQDIQDATKMLIDDLSCNKLQYVSQYIKEYKTDQFTIKYDELVNSGTGNLIVDKILEKYQSNFYRMGVL